MSQAAESSDLINVVVLLGAAVVAIPLFRRLGLGSVLGYLAAGLAIGPFGLGLFDEPQAILHVAELGVVMFLFVIGLEMRPPHLWSLRKEIFGLGTAQIAVCTLVLTGIGMLLGFAPPVAFVAASGFVLTSTAVVMQLLAERGDVALPPGQKIVAILLFEDLLIVPLLAIVAWMGSNGDPQTASQRWQDIGIGLACIVGLLVAGRWLLNPLFRILAASKAREVMTAAALLVVLGAALLMQVGGLSMAMGAFLAGVLLSESTFRHQIEADIEPFRGILLGLFFLGVGMSLDLHVVAADWRLIVAGVLALMVGKGVCIYAVARLMRSDHRQALDRGVLMAQGGEFAFVLFAAASASGVIDAQVNASLTAIVVVSMALTPLFVLLQRRLTPAAKPSLEGVEAVNGQTGSVLIIGFGRFGQVASQSLLARDVDVTIIDNDIEMIQSAEQFGFKIYYGDGTRLDVLHASGAHSARAIAVCVDSREAANRIVELATREFPHARLLVRSYDREHALQLVAAGVDYQIRETFESAVAFGLAALVELGVDEDEAVTIARAIRRRDAERFELEIAAGNTRAGAVSGLMYGNITPTVPKPTPFTPPRRESRTLNPDAVPQANQVEEATGD
ncbi:monovalent cation:proton antiporter-2 (CPA2) family protein [Xanthomonas hortorum]|uniref:Glutathione-regulated potassium-efflux system protein KefC n=3 Tax=Xanthomonas hortorum TaxID=56454 RepID=A0A6V7DGU6_9XANT|nr:monovalent cation:proton antiporter-2 (CPA2) family protein [Xanthomonas hortorum]APP80579.1 potassium transporter [Xanthomonas hortorum pv. gardneri]EGD18484.1 Kef-type potassium/proton antiporter, CPA2 family (TC 2.A.37.1) [Xanthomonas hortorum ATCC 19865]KLA96485.1 potassium transporter [Xanthomonas hortorum pv. gardneri]KLA97503.1 potassium transporter [Xanthomonas hortorum pv. gardneri]KLB04591.1 potassium transporter [Xanthomonas hortorum pv. gardneri]